MNIRTEFVLCDALLSAFSRLFTGVVEDAAELPELEVTSESELEVESVAESESDSESGPLLLSVSVLSSEDDDDESEEFSDTIFLLAGRIRRVRMSSRHSGFSDPSPTGTMHSRNVDGSS